VSIEARSVVYANRKRASPPFGSGSIALDGRKGLFTRAEKNGPDCRGHLRVESRISRRGFDLHCFSSRHVLDHDLLAFVGGIMPSVMPLLDVLRGMRLRLHGLNTL